MSVSNEPGIELLGRLLSLSERSPDRMRPASIAPDYGELRTADAVSRFQAQMAAAERAGAVSIRKGKRERQHLIERITVCNVAALAQHLGRKPADVSAKIARNELDPLIAAAASWLIPVLDEIENRWSRSEPAFRLQPGETELAREFLALLAAISNDQARDLDARTFSLKATGDTKAFDRQATRIATVMAAQLGEPRSNAAAVWKHIGLERFAHPIHLRGTVVVQDQDRVLVDGGAKPFASMHPELLRNLNPLRQPSFLLTIENFASFNRYVREIEDSGLIIYTGGFPSAGLLDVLKSLLGMLGETVPFLHWGDIDPGGVRIFRFLEENLPRKPQPHLMDRSIAEARGKPASRDVSLNSLGRSDSAVASLAEWLAQGNDIRHLEQEALDPMSPGSTASQESAA